MVGRVWTFFVLGEGDFFAGQTVKLWHFDEDFRWWIPRLHPPNGRCAMRIFKTTTNLNLQHASAKPFMMIAACTLTNQEKILQKLNRIPPPYIKYTFSSLMFWFVKKIKTRDFNVHNSSNFFACFAPFNSFWCVFLFFFLKKNGGNIHCEVYTDSTVDAIDGPGSSTYPQATSLDLQSPVVEVCNPNSSK